MSQAADSSKKKPSGEKQTKKKRNETDPDRAWKIARLAAILSIRIPLIRSTEIAGWDEGPPEADDAMELIGHKRQDGIYLSCLRRAGFLMEAAEGAGRVHAADLFEEDKEYGLSEIMARFSSVGWRGGMRDVSIKKLVTEIDTIARERLDAAGEDLSVEQELSEIHWLIRQWEDPPKKLRFGLILKLCQRQRILPDKLVKKRGELSDPPGPRFLPPGELTPDAAKIDMTLRNHYYQLLGLASPWLVTGVADWGETLRIGLEHDSVCPKCRRRCSKGKESVEEIQVEILKMKATIRVRSYALTCPVHNTFSRPYAPPKIPRGAGRRSKPRQ